MNAFTHLLFIVTSVFAFQAEAQSPSKPQIRISPVVNDIMPILMNPGNRLLLNQFYQTSMSGATSGQTPFFNVSTIKVLPEGNSYGAYLNEVFSAVTTASDGSKKEVSLFFQRRNNFDNIISPSKIFVRNIPRGSNTSFNETSFFMPNNGISSH